MTAMALATVLVAHAIASPAGAELTVRRRTHKCAQERMVAAAVMVSVRMASASAHPAMQVSHVLSSWMLDYNHSALAVTTVPVMVSVPTINASVVLVSTVPSVRSPDVQMGAANMAIAPLVSVDANQVGVDQIVKLRPPVQTDAPAMVSATRANVHVSHIGLAPIVRSRLSQLSLARSRMVSSVVALVNASLANASVSLPSLVPTVAPSYKTVRVIAAVHRVVRADSVAASVSPALTDLDANTRRRAHQVASNMVSV